MVKKGWNCPAIAHGATIFPMGKIGPCCMIDGNYLKPISELYNPERFDDLRTLPAPNECRACVSVESQGGRSYRKQLEDIVTFNDGIQFLNLCNTNLCNLKCRYCGPHFSNQWAEELNYEISLNHQSISEFWDILLTDSLHQLYFTGGEPIINRDHWDMLEELIAIGRSASISLMYNTNLTVLKYKDKDIFTIWEKFKSVHINCSIDAVGEPFNYIRSGANFAEVDMNLTRIVNDIKCNHIIVTICPVISILNIWFIDQLFDYAQDKKLTVIPTILNGPDYLSLDVIPDELKNLAQSKINYIKNFDVPESIISQLEDKINNNIGNVLFKQTLAHITLLDSIRQEKLFNLLPFKNVAKDLILQNYEFKQR